eukprot:GFUD01020655.1.p1 GENE.GFUD01020655.1~~GFUD01020655.1.p1  ORF type:complete len:712 (-),score=139.07 GFUD01020655.1:319-2454(-)
MTISYQRDVASSTAGGFTRLLFKWKGSLYKLICRELLLFLIVYTILGVIYRQFMTKTQKLLFESVVKYFDAFLNLIPLSFVLGFYVSYVASRWWQQFLAIPWPDKLFHSIACYVEGFDEDARMLRRSLMRWMNLALILVLRSISSAVKQRFPTLDHVVEAGFMTANEKKLFESVPANEFNTYWVPCTWFVFRLQEATKQGKLLNQYALENIMREFCEFRAKCGLLWCYDWVSIPMVYTQVVTLATYVFFIFTIIGRQKLEGYGEGKRMPSGRQTLDIDLYIPIFTVLQFFFYMGLLKVAEQLINPFGDDDEDFELNWLIDRHVKASFLGCDVLMNPERIPPLVKDYYWDKQDCPIPYTEASMHFKKKTYRGSADDMKVPEDKCHMVLPEIEEEDEDDGQKLSLTSLLLESSNIMTNIGLGELRAPSQNSLSNGKESIGGEVTPSGYEPSPRHARHNPGAWRNGHSAGPGSSRDILAAERFQGSQDSVAPSDDEDLERRGSIPFFTTRRGSRLSDIIQMQDKKKKNRRYKDKQGFTWRPFIPDEELPVPRAPHPHIEKKPELPQITTPLPQPRITSPLPQLKSNGDLKTIRTKSPVAPPKKKSSRSNEETSISITEPFQPDPHIRDADTCSLKSTRSENSFKTASSDPQLNFIPRQVSDSYKLVPQESAAIERKSSVRALQQQQYSALNTVNTNNGTTVNQKQTRTQNKSVR